MCVARAIWHIREPGLVAGDRASVLFRNRNRPGQDSAEAVSQSRPSTLLFASATPLVPLFSARDFYAVEFSAPSADELRGRGAGAPSWTRVQPARPAACWRTARRRRRGRARPPARWSMSIHGCCSVTGGCSCVNLDLACQEDASISATVPDLPLCSGRGFIGSKEDSAARYVLPACRQHGSAPCSLR